MRNKYVFVKDDHSITLYRKQLIKNKESKNYGQETDHLIGHYSNVESVIKKLVHLELIESGTISDLLLDLRAVNEDVSELVKGCLE